MLFLFFVTLPLFAEIPVAIVAQGEGTQIQSPLDRISAFLEFIDPRFSSTTANPDYRAVVDLPATEGEHASIRLYRLSDDREIGAFMTSGTGRDPLFREIARGVARRILDADDSAAPTRGGGSVLNVLDTIVLSDLPGIHEPVDARGIELAGDADDQRRGGVIVGGAGFLVELGEAFDLRRAIPIDGLRVTSIARDTDDRVAFVDDRTAGLFILESGASIPVSVPIDTESGVVLEFAPDGSIVIINLSLRRAFRLREPVLFPIDLFRDSETLIDAFDRGPGGELWSVDRRSGSILVRATDGTIVDALKLPQDILATPIRDISIGNDGSCVLLTADRILRLDPLGRGIDRFSSIHAGSEIPIAQVSDLEYRSATGELYLLDPSGGRVYRALLGQPAPGSVLAELAWIKDSINRAGSRNEVRRLQVRAMSTYERHGAVAMADRIRADLVYEDPFLPLPPPAGIGDRTEETRTASHGTTRFFSAVFTPLPSSAVPPGFAELSAQINRTARDYGLPAYDEMPRAIAAWEMMGMFRLEQDDTLTQGLRPRPSAMVLRNGRANREELLQLLVDLWRAAGLETQILRNSEDVDGALAAFRSAVPAAARDRLGALADAAREIDGELWIGLSPETIGRPFLYAVEETAERYGARGALAKGVFPAPERAVSLASTAGTVPTAAPLPDDSFAERVRRSQARVSESIREPILAVARDRVGRSVGRERMDALNELALADLMAVIPDRGAIERAREIWHGILELDSDWPPAVANLSLLEQLAEGRVELFALPWQHTASAASP